ncbi:MAG: hypothetical protein HRT47_00565 [Candidatus Caenarcaniphilales bacterium]|nr:hypothetical protein [Candidatus Caenarcaniphilales bacterium]
MLSLLTLQPINPEILKESPQEIFTKAPLVQITENKEQKPPSASPRTKAQELLAYAHPPENQPYNSLNVYVKAASQLAELNNANLYNLEQFTNQNSSDENKILLQDFAKASESLGHILPGPPSDGGLIPQISHTIIQNLKVLHKTNEQLTVAIENKNTDKIAELIKDYKEQVTELYSKFYKETMRTVITPSSVDQGAN